MPYLKIHSNVLTDKPKELLTKASAAVAIALDKPETYVMVDYAHNINMVFAGNATPLAYLELKSIQLPEHNTATLSRTLCDLITDTLHITPERIYIEFANAERHMWGWDKRTFAT